MTPSLDEFAFLDATAQAELVRRKQVKPREFVELAVGRVERFNPQINAVVTAMYEQALAAADGVIPEGPFAGVPFLLKDLIASYGGVRTAGGSAFQQDFVPDHDSVFVSRLKRAGLIVIGKSNTPEYGILPTTEPELFGPSRNPWDTSRTTGGSSGGSAAAVAAGLVPMAHAGDGGGSIRIPASCCGLFGLKPTRGRNPLGPDYGDMFSGLIAEHAVTRSVRESAALLDATCGPDVGDPYWAPPPARTFLEEVGARPGKLKIAFSTESLAGTPVHPDCVAAANDAAALCTELGHEVVEASPDLDGGLLIQAFMVLWSAGCAWAIDEMACKTKRSPTPDRFETLTWALYETGRRQSASDYLLALQRLQAATRDIGRFFLSHDVWLTPTLGEPPVPLGTFSSSPEQPLAGMARAVPFAPFPVFCNISGQPGMSVPLFWNSEGLPVGVHFAGRFGDEATLFRLAGQLESARPWAGRYPPMTQR
jgi:amidase